MLKPVELTVNEPYMTLIVPRLTRLPLPYTLPPLPELLTAKFLPRVKVVPASTLRLL